MLGLVNAFQPFLAPMRAARRGTLVGIASVAGFRGLPGSGAYSASKAAAISYLESLRVELRGSGIAVVTICPGLHRDADDRAQSVSDAVPDAAGSRGAQDRARDRAAQALLRAAVADGDRRPACCAALPRPLYDRMFAKAPRKPRRDG